MNFTEIVFIILIIWLVYKFLSKDNDKDSSNIDPKDYKNKDECYSPLYVSRKETEEIAMDAVKHFERENYRKIKNVSNQNVGYDIESWNSKKNRFIEVKGRKNTGNIYMTKNEWEAAQKFGYKYYLYVVYHCDSDEPELRITQNPVRSLNPTYISETKKYKISKSDIVRNSTSYYYQV